MSLRTYVILVQDARTGDTTVYGGRAEGPAQARQLIFKLYEEQDWPLRDIKAIQAYVIRSSQKAGVQQLRQIAASRSEVSQ